MTWDLGLEGLGLLLVMALGFGLVAQLVTWRSTPRWTGLVTVATTFVAGLLTSEGLFGWATEEDLQPNVDGLSTDEVLLSSVITSVATVLVIRAVTRRRHGTPSPPDSAARRPHASAHRH
jgi:hypothetical protein